MLNGMLGEVHTSVSYKGKGVCPRVWVLLAFYFNLWMGLICLIWNSGFKFQVVELFHDLKERVRAFNMCVNDQPCALGQESVYKQRFILQVMLYWLFRGEPLYSKFMTGFLYTSTYKLLSHLCFKILCRLRLQLKKKILFDNLGQLVLLLRVQNSHKVGLLAVPSLLTVHQNKTKSYWDELNCVCRLIFVKVINIL